VLFLLNAQSLDLSFEFGTRRDDVVMAIVELLLFIWVYGPVCKEIIACIGLCVLFQLDLQVR